MAYGIKLFKYIEGSGNGFTIINSISISMRHLDIINCLTFPYLDGDNCCIIHFLHIITKYALAMMVLWKKPKSKPIHFFSAENPVKSNWICTNGFFIDFREISIEFR